MGRFDRCFSARNAEKMPIFRAFGEAEEKAQWAEMGGQVVLESFSELLSWNFYQTFQWLQKYISFEKSQNSTFFILKLDHLKN